MFASLRRAFTGFVLPGRASLFGLALLMLLCTVAAAPSPSSGPHPTPLHVFSRSSRAKLALPYAGLVVKNRFGLKVFTNSIGVKLIELPGGTFQMGDDRFGDARPVHSVFLKSFWIGETEVTNRQFNSFLQRSRPPESRGDFQPATRVTYYQAEMFCQWLTHREHRYYRLPTEAEWEYAARGGLSGQDYPWGAGPPFKKATCFDNVTTNVHTFPPNGYGLYDMGSNVFNWCSDWYLSTFYLHSPPIEPRGPSRPTGLRVIRGGSSRASARPCGMRGFVPAGLDPIYSISDPRGVDGSGFRVVLSN